MAVKLVESGREGNYWSIHGFKDMNREFSHLSQKTINALYVILWVSVFFLKRKKGISLPFHFPSHFPIFGGKKLKNHYSFNIFELNPGTSSIFDFQLISLLCCFEGAAIFFIFSAFSSRYELLSVFSELIGAELSSNLLLMRFYAGFCVVLRVLEYFGLGFDAFY